MSRRLQTAAATWFTSQTRHDVSVSLGGGGITIQLTMGNAIALSLVDRSAGSMALVRLTLYAPMDGAN